MEENLERPLAVRSVERTLASRYRTYIDEVTRFIDAGRTVMEREQTLNPRVSDIVAEAGLSNQAFYRHFRSKSELMLAILDDGSRLMAAYVQKQMAKHVSGIDKIRAWVAGSLTQTAASSAASVSRGVMLNTLELRAEYPEESTRTAQLLRRSLIEAIRLAQQQGEIPETDPELASEMVFRLTATMMETWLIAQHAPTTTELAYLEGFVLSGLHAELPEEIPTRKPKRRKTGSKTTAGDISRRRRPVDRVG